MDREILAQVWQYKNWVCSQSPLHLLETSLTLLKPHKLNILLQQNNHRIYLYREFFNESLIVTSGQGDRKERALGQPDAFKRTRTHKDE
jgi:hypothetical protein